jgi:hypothetical protein
MMIELQAVAAELLADPDRLADACYGDSDDESGDRVDVDQGGVMLVELLSPDLEPPGAWLLGADELDGIGVCTPEQVSAVAAWISTISDAEVAAATSDLGAETADYLGDVFRDLRDFYQRAAQAGAAVAVTVS